jgi:hypothetical protein
MLIYAFNCTEREETIQFSSRTKQHIEYISRYEAEFSSTFKYSIVNDLETL